MITSSRDIQANDAYWLRQETVDIHRYPPMTRTFFPDGSFDLEWVDTSLRMVDLQTQQPPLKHGQTRLVHSLTNTD